MAQILDRKSNFYSQRQSVRDELSAPQYLKSAGDELIKSLAKKQTKTSTSLQEQLGVVQNFEKGFELNPDSRKGITSLEDFKKHVRSEQKTFPSPTKQEKIQDPNELTRITELSRHELELSLSEKPSSQVSQLYMFAIGNKSKRDRREVLEDKLLDHPINHLKEIEEEYFGNVKKVKLKSVTTDSNQEGEEKKPKSGKSRKKRKRKKKKQESPAVDVSKKLEPVAEPQESPVPGKDKKCPKASSSGLSLWDVKDMKKWSASKTLGCKPQAFYTIKNGEIIKVEKEFGKEDST